MNSTISSLLVVGGLVFSVGAQATSTNPAHYSHGPQITDWTTTIAIDQFDASLGTLTGVWIEYEYNVDTHGEITNTNTIEQKFNVSTKTTLLMDFNGSDEKIEADLFTTGFLTYDPGEKKDFGPFSDTKSGMLEITSDLAAWIGNGSIDSMWSTFGGLTVEGGGGNVSADIETSASAAIDVVYHYEATPVPVPPSLLLMGTGILGLFGASRKRVRT